jgi:carboxypeptidase Q
MIESSDAHRSGKPGTPADRRGIGAGLMGTMALTLAIYSAAGCQTSHTHKAEAPAPAAAQDEGGFKRDWVREEVKLASVPKGPFAVIDGKVAPVPAIKMGDPATVKRIIEIGKNQNRVMDHLRHLSEKIGPRLTGSTNAELANNWTRDQFAAWGLTNAHLEAWGTIPVRFDRGPSTGKVYQAAPARGAEREATAVRDLEFTTMAWTPGTNGPARGVVIKEPRTEEEYAAVKSKLKGAWVLLSPPNATGQRGVRSPGRSRYESRVAAEKKVREGTDPSTLPIIDRMNFDGILGFISSSRDERVWTSAAPGWRELTMETISKTPEVVVRGSDYDFINSRVFDAAPIEVEFNLAHTFTPGPFSTYNTIAEIRGTEKPDEVVIVSGHMDSWNGPGSQGTTDNGTGSSVTLEAARILMQAKAKPKRTIRFVLWTGEEQGLLGSRGYVEAHKAEMPKISAVFVDDGGTNYQGGIPVADQMADYFAAATAPVNAAFPDMVVNIRKTGKKNESHGSSDQASFNAVGVPGFFWDEVGKADYGYGWHTQHDRINLAIPEYLVQSSTNAAVVAYNLACAPDLLPRAIQDPPKEEKKPETAPAAN